MRRRITRLLVLGTLSASLAICLGTMLGASAEVTIGCHSKSCPGKSWCSGDLYDRNGCDVSCYKIVRGDQIEDVGYALCQEPTDD